MAKMAKVTDGVLLMVTIAQFVKTTTADLNIYIPDNLSEGGEYRLDYYPVHGNPPPNTTFQASKDILAITLSDVLPGTTYNFSLYYSNATHKNQLTSSASFTTAPNPPSWLIVSVTGGKEAIVSWNPPNKGGFTSFKLKINPLTDTPGLAINEVNVYNTDISKTAAQINSYQVYLFLGEVPVTIVDITSLTYKLINLTPGASYQVQAFTVFENKESVNYISQNITTMPDTTGKFLTWFRNETSLMIVWQPSSPTGIYTSYKVSIDPPDAFKSVLHYEVDKSSLYETTFMGLTPGRLYNTTIQTISKDQISVPTIAQYRTIPRRPENVTVDKNEITSNSFVVHWEPPTEKSEFNQYQISLVTLRQSIYIPKEKLTKWEFKDKLEPGKTYLVTVKTLSGKVSSWPVSVEVTLKPLPVNHLKAMIVKRNGEITLSWKPHPNSTQDNFLVSYHDVESTAGITNTVLTNQTKIELDMLLPQINYLITVQAVSRDTQSKEESIYVVTKQSAPATEDLKYMDKEYPIFMCNNGDLTLSDIRRRSIHAVFFDEAHEVDSSKLTNARESESERYDCKILPKSYPKQHKDDTYMNVLTAPKFVLTSGDFIQINLGEAITINCKVEGTPTPQILWFKDGNLLVSTAAIGISPDGAELRISNILQEDIGAYTCLARNEGGQNLHTSKLIIAGSPVHGCSLITLSCT